MFPWPPASAPLGGWEKINYIEELACGDLHGWALTCCKAVLPVGSEGACLPGLLQRRASWSLDVPVLSNSKKAAAAILQYTDM